MAKKRRASTRKPRAGKPLVDLPVGDRMSDIPGSDVPEDKSTRKTATKDQKDDHHEALDRYEVAYNKERKNQDLAYEDLRFETGDGQWEERAKQEREAEGRPILVVNKCPQFKRQVTGDIRQLRPAIRVVPVDDAASKDVATKVLPGMIRYIEQRSDAKGAYFAAADQQVAAGIGHCRVYTEYAAGSTMQQEVCIAAIEDGISVLWDPDAIHPTRKDAMFCFVPVDMAKSKFEDKWPDANADPLTESKELFYTWFTDDYVRVTEYWRKVPTKRKFAAYPTGQLIDLTDEVQPIESGPTGYGVGEPTEKPEGMVSSGAKWADALAGDATIEEKDSYKVERLVISASEILEGPETWPGMEIPIVPFLGEETKIGREIIRSGVLRNLKDVQRIYNYAMSADAESVALQPKAPWIGTRKQFEKYRDQWETANSRNWPYLEYEHDDKVGGPPQRVAPPAASTGIHELLTVATGDMSGVTGIYPASLGQASNESSGKAIIARQREGDTGTYVYIENFGRAVQRVGEIVIDLIQHVYDTPRKVSIVGEDGKIDALDINKTIIDPNGDGIATVVENNVLVGSYEVVVEMGPSYSTKREEARDGMQQFMQAAGPQTAALYIDLFAKMQDWPLADKIAKRAQALLPPPIQMMEAQESGEPPLPQMPPPGPTPEQQAEMAAKAQEFQLKQTDQALNNRKIDAELARIQADVEMANRSHEAAMAGHACTIAQLQHGGKGGAGGDKRVDALADAVEQLNSVVSEIANALGLTGASAQGGAPSPQSPPGPVSGNGGGSPPPAPPAPGAPFGAPPPLQ